MSPLEMIVTGLVCLMVGSGVVAYVAAILEDPPEGSPPKLRRRRRRRRPPRIQ